VCYYYSENYTEKSACEIQLVYCYQSIINNFAYWSVLHIT